MSIRYRSGELESTMESPAALAAALAAGNIAAESKVLDDARNEWVPIAEFLASHEPGPASAPAPVEPPKAEPPADDRMARLIRISAWVIMIASVLFFANTPGIRAEQVGEALGRLLVLGLIAGIILAAIGNGRTLLFKAGLRMVAAFLVVGYFVFSAFSIKQQNADSHEAIDGIAKLGEQMLEHQEQLASGGPIPDSPAIEAPARRTKVPVGNLSQSEMLVEIQAVMQEIGAKTVQDQNQLARELEALRLEVALAPETLVSRRGIEETRAKLKAWRALLHKEKEMVDQRLVETRGLIKERIGSSSMSKALMERFEEGVQKRKSIDSRVFYANMESIDAAEALTEFMAGKLGHTHVENGDVAFETAPELAEYNKLVTGVQDSIAAGEVAQQELMEYLRSGVKKLKELSGSTQN